MPRRTKSDKCCPVDHVLCMLMGPWTTYLLWLLHSNGPMRFGALKAGAAGISAKVLTERLRHLEEVGLIHRDYLATIPPQVTYSLTARGRELRVMLDELAAVSLRWQAEDAAALRAAPALAKTA